MAILRISNEVMAELKSYNAKKFDGDVYGKITKTVEVAIKEHIESDKKIIALGNTINDLTLSLSMWIEGYPFDKNHKAKQKQMIDNACVMIGKPRTTEELKKMMDL